MLSVQAARHAVVIGYGEHQAGDGEIAFLAHKGATLQLFPDGQVLLDGWHVGVDSEVVAAFRRNFGMSFYSNLPTNVFKWESRTKELEALLSDFVKVSDGSVVVSSLRERISSNTDPNARGDIIQPGDIFFRNAAGFPLHFMPGGIARSCEVEARIPGEGGPQIMEWLGELMLLGKG